MWQEVAEKIHPLPMPSQLASNFFHQRLLLNYSDGKVVESIPLKSSTEAYGAGLVVHSGARSTSITQGMQKLIGAATGFKFEGKDDAGSDIAKSKLVDFV